MIHAAGCTLLQNDHGVHPGPCSAGTHVKVHVEGEIDADKVRQEVERLTRRPTEVDLVNSPPHYQRGGFQVIEIIEAFGLGFRLGNVVKYILRADAKGATLQDLKKARWYLDREITKLEETP